MTTNYLYNLYGTDENFYLEAAYSIGTLLKRVKADSSRIIVFTDRPEKIQKWPVICEDVAKDLPEMQGATGFIHRTKLCVILRCVEKYSGNVVLMDSDTFVRGDFQHLVERLAPGRAIMDSFESRNPLPELEGFEATLPDATAYRYTKDSRMCNAGVIGIHRDDAHLIRRALALCDAFLATGLKRHTFEQFAVSEVFRLAATEMVYSREAVTHYFKAKPYMRKQISRRIRNTAKSPWEFERTIPYSYPYVKILKLVGLHP